MSETDECGVGASEIAQRNSHPLPAPDGNQPAVLADAVEDQQPVEPYFWEQGGNTNISWWAKVRHALHFGGAQAMAGAEVVGEACTIFYAWRFVEPVNPYTLEGREYSYRRAKVVANTLGLTDSKYQYVIDALEADKIRREHEERDEWDKQQLEMSIKAASGGAVRGTNVGEMVDASVVELGGTIVSQPAKETVIGGMQHPPARSSAT